MGLAAVISNEIQLRDKGEYGILHHMPYLYLLCLAYKMNLTI